MSSVINHDEPIVLNRCGYNLSLDNPSDINRIGGPIVARTINHNRSANHFSMLSAPQSLFPGNGEQLVNVGLYQALQIKAQRQNVQLRIRATAPINTLPPPRPEIQRFPELANFLFANPQGLITYSKSIKPAEIVKYVHLAFPENRKVVISDRTQKLRNLYNKLRPDINSIHLADPQSPLDWTEANGLPKLILSTPYAVSDYEFPSTDIVIVLEARTCTHRRMKDALSQIDLRAGLYGLQPRGFSLSPAEADYVIATFGFHQLDLFNDSKVSRPTQLIRIPYQKRYRLRSDQNNFAKSLYWENRSRNNLICDLARKLYSGQNTELLQDLDRQNWSTTGPKITILVDRPQHAMELAKRLTDWPVSIMQEVLPYCSGAFRRRVENLSRNWLGEDKQIMLTDYAQNASIEDFDILIWAAGTPYIDGIPKRFFRSAPGALRPLTIIDFDDRGNRHTKKFSNRRLEQFYQLGIFPPGISTASGRAALFLRNQPNGA